LLKSGEYTARLKWTFLYLNRDGNLGLPAYGQEMELRRILSFFDKRVSVYGYNKSIKRVKL
jgi:hypothetical protein